MPHLDARYLLCPLPVIRLQAFIAPLPAGEIVTVCCSDPGARQDIPAWCRLEGHQVLDIHTEPDGDLVMTIRVRP